MTERVDLSIIIVEHNCANLLHATLRSINQHTCSVPYETIVISNGSFDPQLESLQHVFPHTRCVRSPQHAGFAAANNLGMSLSSGRYIALLNPDTILHTDALSALVSFLHNHPQVGAVGPRLIQPDGRAQPYSYGDAPSPLYLLRRLWSHVHGTYLHDWSGSELRQVGWVAATCLVTRRVVWDAVGPLDEQFYLYFEDVDWGMRVRRAGWKVVFLPDVTITHLGGGSVGPHTTPHYDRSLVRFYAKHYSGLAAAGVWWALHGYRFGQQMRYRLQGRA